MIAIFVESSTLWKSAALNGGCFEMVESDRKLHRFRPQPIHAIPHAESQHHR